MQTGQRELAYHIYLELMVEKTGKNEDELKAEIGLEAFEKQVRQLHYQWMCGEFSFGKFTEIIGIPHWELWEILDALGLQIHR
ncbi:MAG: hypothetical protein H7175_12105 [Burkholderiales bacterium]|nr:hypothetical protein [Anaerolineae bacterium]